MSDTRREHGATDEPLSADVAAGHELSDVNIRGLLVFLAALVVSLAVTVFAIAWLFSFLTARALEQDPAPPPLADLREKKPPAPRLQESPKFDLQRMQDQQETALKRTRWIDRQAKVVQIPIDRAMQLVAERGLPDWPRAEVEKSAGNDKATGNDKSTGNETKRGEEKAGQRSGEPPPGTGKNPAAKSREAVPEKQESDVLPRRADSQNRNEEKQ